MTAYHLRRFTEEGVAAFDEALQAIRDNTRQHLPDDLVMNDALAPVLDPDIYVTQKKLHRQAHDCQRPASRAGTGRFTEQIL